MPAPRLLAVTKDDQAVEALQAFAGTRGFSVTVAGSLLELRERLIERKPGAQSLVILDADGVDVDGVELVHMVAAGHREAPVILMGSGDSRTLGAVHNVAAMRGLKLKTRRPLPKPVGENQWVRPILDALRIEDRTITADDIRRALEGDEVRLDYQPLVDVKTKCVRTAEALLRWQHPEYGALEPSQIILQAESHGLSVSLTEWVLTTALRQVHEWRTKHDWNIKVAVNASATVLQSEGFAERVAAIADEIGVPTAALVLEVTENDTMEEEVQVLEAVTRLRLRDVDLSIDDFGTGYSSLGRLKFMPFSELKIDRSFVEHAPGDEQAQAIVRAILDLGHNLDMTVVAEGVSTRESWDLVSELGCDVAQGYFISRPMRAHDFTEWLYRWNVPQGVTPPMEAKPADEAKPRTARRRAARRKSPTT